MCLRIILAMLCMSLTACVSATQGGVLGNLRVDPDIRNCNPLDRQFDNPFHDTRGWVMPRIAWWTFYPALTYAGAKALQQAPRLVGKGPMSDLKAAMISHASIAIVPHVRGYAKGAYGIRPRDWAFDFVDRDLVVLWSLGAKAPSPAWGKAASVAVWAGATAYLSCYAVP